MPVRGSIWQENKCNSSNLSNLSSSAVVPEKREDASYDSAWSHCSFGELATSFKSGLLTSSGFRSSDCRHGPNASPPWVRVDKQMLLTQPHGRRSLKGCRYGIDTPRHTWVPLLIFPTGSGLLRIAYFTGRHSRSSVPGQSKDKLLHSGALS